MTVLGVVGDLAWALSGVLAMAVLVILLQVVRELRDSWRP